jgi:hypothetical protein
MPPADERPTKDISVSSNARAILEASNIDAAGARFHRITGGISSSTFAAHLPTGGVIIKQALEQLDVTEDWKASPTRVVAEAEGLTWFSALTPQHVPRPIAVVKHLFGLVLPMAPQPSPDMRTVLVENPGDFDPRWPQLLGEILALWHGADYRPALGGALDDTSRLMDLRLKPFYLDIAQKWPTHTTKIKELADELLTVKSTVVHGDFTPKNVLCLPDGNIWIVDTEVCHIGNPVLDSASMLAHLILKGFLYRSDTEMTQVLHLSRNEFLDALPEPSTPDSLAAHVGVFLAVRAAGRARVPYLSEATKQDVIEMAQALLNGVGLEEGCQQWLP